MRLSGERRISVITADILFGSSTQHAVYKEQVYVVKTCFDDVQNNPGHPQKYCPANG